MSDPWKDAAIRALLLAEYGGLNPYSDPCCPVCNRPISLVDDPSFEPYTHKPDCALDAALRVAGVPRPSPQFAADWKRWHDAKDE